MDSLKLKYMLRCLELASYGLGRVAPNPMVGAVLVVDDTIIGEGYHKAFGEPHAEVMAIRSVCDQDLLKNATLYVNLEPCSHFGKTPPCAELIIKSGIQKVVVGNEDPFPQVSGNGIRRLREAGIDVEVGCMDDECRFLNRRFFTFYERKRPYIILKWAQTADGFIDSLRKDVGQPNWIIGENSRLLVHRWRTEEQAIIVGTKTAIIDNPRLNVRDWQGRQPLRIVIDRELKLPNELHLFDRSSPTLVFSANKKESITNLEYVQLDFSENIIHQMCNELWRRNIQSVIIEGGSKLLQSFIDSDTWDEARVFKGNIHFEDGIYAPKLPVKKLSETEMSDAVLEYYKK